MTLDTGSIESKAKEIKGIPFWKRVALPAACLTITTLLSLTIFLLAVFKIKFTGDGYTWYKAHPYETSVIVSVLGPVLAFIQTLPLLSTISYMGRSKWTTKEFSLTELQFWTKLSDAKPLFGRLKFTFWTLVVLTLVQGTGTIWFSAMLPVDDIATVATNISVTAYTADPGGQLWNQTWNANVAIGMAYVGNESYTFYPGQSMASSLLSSAAVASNNDSSPRRHSKSSGSLYTYVGRSYGIGAPVGLVDPAALTQYKSPLLSYSYNESGYNTDVTCTYNKTSNWNITLEYDTGTSEYPNIYLASGSIAPGHTTEFYAVLGFDSPNYTVALVAGGHDITNNIIMAAGPFYDEMNNVQCAVRFEPTLFNVTADRSSQEITIALLGNGSNVDSTSKTQPHGRGRLQQAALWELTRLSMRNTGLYSSPIGESLRANIQRRSALWDTSQATQQQVLESIADSFQAVLDDILLATSSAQFVIAGNGRTSAPAEMTVAAIVIGKLVAVIAVFLLNVGIVLFWTIMACRTKCWKDVPTFDFCEVTDILAGASRGGPHLAEAAAIRKDAIDVREESLTKWQSLCLPLTDMFRKEQYPDPLVRLSKTGSTYDTLELAHMLPEQLSSTQTKTGVAVSIQPPNAAIDTRASGTERGGW